MKKIERILKIDLPRGRSAFLWGPRKTGKSTYLTNAFPKNPYFDFVRTDVALEYAKRPALLRERILALDSESLRSPIILGEGEVAIEIKGTSRVDQRDLASIRSFAADYRPKKSLVVCNEKEERVVGSLRIMPWRKFLEDLWGGRIIA